MDDETRAAIAAVQEFATKAATTASRARAETMVLSIAVARLAHETKAVPVLRDQLRGFPIPTDVSAEAQARLQRALDDLLELLPG